MPLRKAARVGAALAVLFALWFVVHRLPVRALVIAGAKALHEMGWPGALYTAAAVYLLTLFLFPIIPLIIACGWLHGLWGAPLSLAAAVASASTNAGTRYKPRASITLARGGAREALPVILSPSMWSAPGSTLPEMPVSGRRCPTGSGFGSTILAPSIQVTRAD